MPVCMLPHLEASLHTRCLAAAGMLLSCPFPHPLHVRVLPCVYMNLIDIRNVCAVCPSTAQEHAGKYSSVTAVVDPPRAGLHKLVLRALLGCAAVKRLVYVSCNPQSLASNLVLLCQPWKAQAELQPEHQRGGEALCNGLAGRTKCQGGRIKAEGLWQCV